MDLDDFRWLLGPDGHVSYFGLLEQDKRTLLAPGSRPEPRRFRAMLVDFGSGASGFTLYGMSEMGGDITSGASNITIVNSVFTSSMGEN